MIGACPPKGAAPATLAAPPESGVAPMPGMLTGGAAPPNNPA